METNNKQELKISVICSFNNESLLNRFLIPSVKQQRYSNYEIVLVDSKKLGFKKASDALNYGYSVSTGDILLFVHQDVELLNCDTFSNINNYCCNYDFGVAGVAGIVEREKKVYSSVFQGITHQVAGEKTNNPIYVDSVDECLFFIKRNEFKMFDDLGETWHLYAASYSLKCKINNEKVVIVPIQIYHYSPGWSLDNSYWKTIIVLANKYRRKTQTIPTVFGIFPNIVFLPFYIELKKLSVKIKKHVRKIVNKNE